MKDNIYTAYIDNGPSAPVIYTVGSADFAHGQLGTTVQNYIEKGYIQVKKRMKSNKKLNSYLFTHAVRSVLSFEN